MTKTLISLNQLEKSDVGNKTIVTNGFGVPVYVDYNSPFLPFLPLSGGTVSGATNFTNGLTANTISTTTFSSNTETIIGSVPTSATGSVSTGQSPRSVYTQGKYAYVVNDASKTLQIIMCQIRHLRFQLDQYLRDQVRIAFMFKEDMLML